MTLRLGHEPTPGVLLGEDEMDDRLVAAGAEMSMAGFRRALEVAAPPADLGEVGEGLAVERAGAGHLLERGARERQQPAPQVDAREARVGAALRDDRDRRGRHRDARGARRSGGAGAGLGAGTPGGPETAPAGGSAASESGPSGWGGAGGGAGCGADGAGAASGAGGAGGGTDPGGIAPDGGGGPGGGIAPGAVPMGGRGSGPPYGRRSCGPWLAGPHWSGNG